MSNNLTCKRLLSSDLTIKSLSYGGRWALCFLLLLGDYSSTTREVESFSPFPASVKRGLGLHVHFKQQSLHDSNKRLRYGSKPRICVGMSTAYASSNQESSRNRDDSDNDGSTAFESSMQSLRNMTQAYLDELAATETDDYDAEALREQALTVAGRLQAKRSPSTRVGEKATILSCDEATQTLIFEAAFPLKGKVNDSPFPPPLVLKEDTTVASTPLAITSSSMIGMTLRQISASNGKLSNIVLDLDSQQYIRASELKDKKQDDVLVMEDMDQEDTLDSELAGVLVSSVNINGYAYRIGIRPGDWVLATSATIGEQLWPKSTLEGIRSALTSRNFMSSKPELVIRFRRSQAQIEESEVVEAFELSLSRPIGMQIENIKDLDEQDLKRFGFQSRGPGVVVTGFSSDGSSAASYLKEGDRIVAVESSLGSKMWPVSSTDGVVSAVTSRIPGQPVKFRFERTMQVGGYLTNNNKSSTDMNGAASVNSNEQTLTDDGKNLSELIEMNEGSISALSGAVEGYRKLASTLAPQISTEIVQDSKVIQSAGSKTHRMLLARCRDILRTYNRKAREYYLIDDVVNANRILKLVGDRVLDALADASAPLDAKTLSMIMNTYISGNVAEKALETFELATGLSSNGSHVKVYVRDDNNGRGNNNGSGIPQSQITTLNLYTATALLKAHAARNDAASAWRILASMSQQTSGIEDIIKYNIPSVDWPIQIRPDSQCYNIILEATANSKEKGYGLVQALNLFDKMPDKTALSQLQSNQTLPPRTLVTYNTMLAAFANEGRSEDAYTVFYRLKNAGLKPDKVTYTTLIKAQVEDGLVSKGIELLAEMQKARVPADVLTYNTLIKALCKRGKWYEAQNLVAEMEGRGIAPNAVTYVLLMNGLLKAKRPSTCLTLFETAASDPRTAPLTENVQVYTTAITAASALGDYERAMELVARMQAVGVKPTVKTLTSLMNSCLASDKAELALNVYEQMKRLVSSAKDRSGVIDGKALTVVLKAFCDSGNFHEASKIMSEQRDGRRAMSGSEVMKNYQYLINSALHNNEYLVARSAFEELLSSGYIPSKDFMRFGIVQGMELTGRQKQNIPKAQFDDSAKFDFLLFVLDSLKQRNLSCDTSIYAAVLFEGVRIGGSRKLIASLVAKSRGGDVLNKSATSVTWESMKNLTAGELRSMVQKGSTRIPSIKVPKATDERDVRLLINAERPFSMSPIKRKLENNTVE